MKKLLVTAFTFILLFSFTACSDSKSDTNDSTTKKQEVASTPKQWLDSSHHAYVMSYSLNQNNAVSKGMYLAISKDGKTFTPINYGGAIYYEKKGLGNLVAPCLFRKEDNSFGVVSAEDTGSTSISILSSKDLIDYNFESSYELADGKNVFTPKCEYDSKSKSYNLYWSVGVNTFKKETNDFNKFTESSKTSYLWQDYTQVVAPENAVIGSIIGISENEYDTLMKEYGFEDIKVVDSTSNIPNPLVEERADPWIIQGEDGYYYFTASYPMVGDNDVEGYSKVILRRSKTIEGLKDAEEKVIWHESEEDSVNRFIWAPELHNIDGTWYVFFAGGIVPNDLYSVRAQVLKCSGSDPFNDSWEYVGRFKPKSGGNSFNNFSLDMTYFTVNDKHYVIWAEIVGASSLFIGEIDPKEPWILTSAATLITKPEFNWEKEVHQVNEGAAVLIRDGKVLVTFSASGTGSEYCIGLIWADEKSDMLSSSSWNKLGTPLLTTNDLVGESGPGHNSFATDEKGNVFLVYHARPSTHLTGDCGTFHGNSLVDPCRHARIKQIYFSNEGLPILRAK